MVLRTGQGKRQSGGVGSVSWWCLQVRVLWVTRDLTDQIPLYFVSGTMKKRTRDVDILVSGVKYKPNADSIIFDHNTF